VIGKSDIVRAPEKASMAGEPPVDQVVGAIQLARARAKYHGVTKGVTASLLDIQWLLDQTTANEGVLGKETRSLVERYLEMEVPYRMQQLKEFLEAVEGLGLDVGELPQTLEKLESERERQAAWLRAGPDDQGEGREEARNVLEDLTGFAKQLDSVGKDLDKQAYDFLVEFIQNNRLSKELANSLLEREEVADG
jgi:hypothetical protein